MVIQRLADDSAPSLGSPQNLGTMRTRVKQRHNWGTPNFQESPAFLPLIQFWGTELSHPLRMSTLQAGERGLSEGFGWRCGHRDVEDHIGRWTDGKCTHAPHVFLEGQAKSGWWWLEPWNFIFPYIGNSNPNWLIFFRGVETTNQKCMGLWYHNPDVDIVSRFQGFQGPMFLIISLYLKPLAPPEVVSVTPREVCGRDADARLARGHAIGGRANVLGT